MFGGGAAKKREQELQAQVARLQEQLGERNQTLQQQENELQNEQQKLAAAQREREKLETNCEQYSEQKDNLAELVRKSEEAASQAAASLSQKLDEKDKALSELDKKDKAELESREAELESRAAAMSKLTDELSEATKQLEVRGRAVDELQVAQETAKRHLAESEQQAEELRKNCDEQTALLEEQRRDRAAAHRFVDVSVSGCEFASAFAYSMQFQLVGNSEIRHTDVAPASARPSFNIASVLLPSDDHVSEDVLQVSVFANVVDPVAKDAPPVQRLLGEASLKLTDLQISAGSTSSSKVVKSVEFVRKPGANVEGDGAQRLVVGRANLTLQAKTVTPSELSAIDTAKTQRSDPVGALPSLERSLWTATPFQHRVCAIVHHAAALPLPPEDGRATVRVALRLRRPDGQVLYESLSTDVPIKSPGDTGVSASASFAQELLLPLKLAESSPDVRVQLSLEVVSVAGSGGATNAALLDLNWAADALPYFRPLHLRACPSDEASKAPSIARPRPSIMVSLVREATHEHLDRLGDGIQHGVEFRVHGVPHTRPLPDSVEDVFLAVCAEPASADADSPQVPIATFFYDQPLDLGTFMKSHFQSSAGKVPDYFLTPVLAPQSCTPQWNQFVMRFLASPVGISSLSIFLFHNGGSHAEPGASLGGTLLGFASVDARSLQEAQVAGPPIHKSFLVDLRLLEAPGAGSSLELECRVWPRGGVPGLQTGAVVPTSGVEPQFSARSVQSSVGVNEALGQEAHDFRLNHELSVQLAKEFNLRAAALKKAGEEIVGLRRQVQMLQAENARLKSQVEDEERLALDVQRRPPPEGFDRLSSTELASKLQRALEKYREEKSKGAELERRLEEASKEASRGRGLQRTLGELEAAHMQQNKELQRLQDENKKIDKYRQAAKTQEKVIAKLEKILESSLQEVQKAQRVQVDMEKLKTENLRLREKCADLAARRRGAKAGEDDVEDLSRLLGEKDREVAKLEAIVRELRSRPGQAPASTSGASADLTAERRKLSELQESRVEWEQRCVAAEHRLSMLEQQLTESSKRYGGEITALQVEIAKRDAKVLELEFLLKEQGVTIPAPP